MDALAPAIGAIADESAVASRTPALTPRSAEAAATSAEPTTSATEPSTASSKPWCTAATRPSGRARDTAGLACHARSRQTARTQCAEGGPAQSEIVLAGLQPIA